MRDYTYCPRCRHELTEITDEPANPHVRCARCGFTKWDNPLPSTIGVLVDGSSVLLLRRAHPPCAGSWDAVGGFLNPGESAEDCLRREAREEIGCGIELGRFLGTFPSVYGESGLRTLGIAFSCRLAGGEIRLSGENDSFGWFRGDDLPQLAFGDVAAAVASWFAAR